MFVITYDNGAYYREWASFPQPTPKEAWSAASLKPGGQYWKGSDCRLEQVVKDGVSIPVNEQ